MNQSFPPSESAPSSTKLNAPSEQVSNAASVAKRLQAELMSLMMAGLEGISAFPEDDGDLTKWAGRIEGAHGTVYATHVYAISLSFPPTYPYAAPTVRFESTCYHPNVDLHGNICLGTSSQSPPSSFRADESDVDILKEKWSPMLSVSTLLISIQSLLGEPNNRSPLNVEAADLWDNVEAYKKELAKHYRPIDEE